MMIVYGSDGNDGDSVKADGDGDSNDNAWCDSNGNDSATAKPKNAEKDFTFG